MTFIKSLWGRPSTIRTYTSLFTNHIEPRLNIDQARIATIETLEDMTKEWIEHDYEPNTVRALIRLAARYIKWAGGEDIKTQRLINQIDRHKVKPPVKCLRPVQLKKLLDWLEVNDPELYFACLLASHAGLRRGEVLGLQWGDFNATRNKIEVRRSYDGPTKNGRPRDVPISERLEKWLWVVDYLNQPLERKVFPSAFDPNPPLRFALKETLCPRIVFHDLRHTFATLGLESGVSPKQMQIWLGHSSVKTTLDIYWQCFPDEAELTFLN